MVEEILRNYRIVKSRLAYLRSQLEMLERFLKICENSMVNDMVSLSQEITGMPHGSNVGDPTGRLALDILSGGVTPFVKQIREEIDKIQPELYTLNRKDRIAEIILEALSEREREIVLLKISDDMSWDEALRAMNDKHNNSYSKRSLQRLMARALDKAEEVVR